MRSKPLWIGTSWKMNKTPDEARRAANVLATITIPEHVRSFVIPPFTSISDVVRILKDTKFQVGAQNIHWEDAGAWTGEISPVMAKECGAVVAEIGHSERRLYFNETDETVNLKVAAALRHKMIPLVCIGDSEADHGYGVTHETLARQAKIALHGVQADDLPKILFAYEPVWAIGAKGRAAEAEFVQDAHARLRGVFKQCYGADVAHNMNILYGGSVSLENAARYTSQPDIDGIFIGRAAWDPRDFEAIMKAVA